jgi:hypothetical protein
MLAHVLDWIHGFNLNGIERTGFQQGWLAVRTQKNDARMVHAGCAGRPVPDARPARSIGGEENVARLRMVNLCRASQDRIQAKSGLVEVRCRWCGRGFGLERGTKQNRGE